MWMKYLQQPLFVKLLGALRSREITISSLPLELRINMGNRKRTLTILDPRNHEQDLSDDQRDPIMKGISTIAHLRW